MTDFEVNAGGTLTLLEAVRRSNPEAVLAYASTNKVYGALSGRRHPVDESQPLDFHTPYGCSKGTADQYVRDYGRVFGLRTIVLRQSCIYGAHQYGGEDQGWVAHFAHSAIGRRPIVIYGDGHQVRDLLDVRDLCRLLELAIERADDCRGMVFNVGGGPANARSVLQVVDAIERITGTRVARSFGDRRPGDQHYYVSDIDRIRTVLGWTPDIDLETGLSSLVGWASSVKAFVRAA
jgi:CDP-paratose 2-epimerase